MHWYVAPTHTNTYGAALIGYTLATCIYGLNCAQATRYFVVHYREDRKVLKHAICGLWVIDTIHTALVTHMIYYFLILLRTRTDPASATLWSDGVSIIIANLNDFGVRCIFLGRIYVLTKKNKPLCLFLAVVMCVTTVIGIYCGVLYTLSSPEVLSGEIEWPVLFAFSMSALSDVAISVALCMQLRRLSHDVESAFPLLRTLGLYVVKCSLLPSAIALVCLLTYILYPGTFIYSSIFFILPKASFNSLLSMLNDRRRLRLVLPKASMAQAEASLENALQNIQSPVPRPFQENNRVRRRAPTVVEHHHL